MTRLRQIINASKLGEHGLRLIGTTDIDGNGTTHEITDVDPIVLFDFATFSTRDELPFRPHPHLGLTAMSFLPVNGTWMAWDSLKGETEAHFHAGGLYYVHAGSPAFHRAQGLVGHRRGHTDPSVVTPIHRALNRNPNWYIVLLRFARDLPRRPALVRLDGPTPLQGRKRSATEPQSTVGLRGIG